MSYSLAAAPALNFSSAMDRGEFYTFPVAEQASIRARHAAMLRIAAAKNANQGVLAEVATAGALGLAKQTLRAMYDRWKTERDWRELVNKAKFPAAREKELPAAFVTGVIHVHFCENQRANKPGWRKIIRRWRDWYRTGDPRFALIGYDECPPPGPRGRHPTGWGYENMNRHRPHRAVLLMARIGSHAARAVLPFIPGTREGCRWLEYVSGDDVKLDRKVYVPGFGPCEVLQFGFVDYGASYYLEEFVQRPAIPRPDGTREKLARRDFLWSVAMMLEVRGYPLDWPMHLLCERGTATMTKAEARFLYELSEGQILVGYSGMEGEFVHAWDERKTGNSRAKGCHESIHNLLHNECADFAGQTGKDRDHAPALAMARERHTLLLDNAAVQLPPEERARLITPYSNAEECLLQTKERIGFINTRNLHDCENFGTVLEWRPRGFAALPRPAHELAAWLEKNPRAAEEDVEWFPRMETPAERARKIAQGGRFQRIPSGALARFYEDLCELRRVRDDYSFEFTRDKRTYRFAPPTPEEALEPGTEVLGFFRPDAECIHLFAKSTERYLLTWPAEKRLRRDDATGKQLAFRRKALFFSSALAAVRDATTGQVEAAQAAARQNAEVIYDNAAILAPEGCTRTAEAVQEITVARQQSASQVRAAAARDDRAAEQAKREADAARAARARELMQDA